MSDLEKRRDPETANYAAEVLGMLLEHHYVIMQIYRQYEPLLRGYALAEVEGLSQAFPRLRHIWTDSAYQGCFETLAAEVGLTVEIVQSSNSQVGFAVQARRWVVERSWLGLAIIAA